MQNTDLGNHERHEKTQKNNDLENTDHTDYTEMPRRRSRQIAAEGGAYG